MTEDMEQWMKRSNDKLYREVQPVSTKIWIDVVRGKVGSSNKENENSSLDRPSLDLHLS